MRIETVRITADWLKRSDFGVNHYLSLVPRDAGDPKPPAIPETGFGLLSIQQDRSMLE